MTAGAGRRSAKEILEEEDEQADRHQYADCLKSAHLIQEIEDHRKKRLEIHA
jgi:hypothetical protein